MSVIGKLWQEMLDRPLGIPLTLRHFYFFDQHLPASKQPALSSPLVWDQLRIEHSHFYQADTRDAWLASLDEYKDGQESSLVDRATDIARVLLDRNIEDVHSVGVGCAGLEYHLKRTLPSIRLTVSEFAPANVERLRRVFYECDQIALFDVSSGDWFAIQPNGSPGNAVMMYRVDPCLSNAQWRTTFRSMASSGVKNILFIPDMFVSLRYVRTLQSRRFEARVTGRSITFTGYVRTEKAFHSLWRGIYAFEPLFVGDRNAYWLTLPTGSKS